MCAYCNMGDTWWKYGPPFPVSPLHPSYPYLPQPLPNAPTVPWDLDKLREYHDLLKRVKELEERVGCPCEPNKADYLKLFEERIAELERRVGKEQAP